MAFLPKALVLLQLAVVCVQLSQVITLTIPDRCWCLDSLKKRVLKEDIEEFSIIPKRAKCNSVEIILTLKPVNATKARCLSPETKQAFNLQNCWTRRNTNGTRSTVKMSECTHIQK